MKKFVNTFFEFHGDFKKYIATLPNLVEGGLDRFVFDRSYSRRISDENRIETFPEAVMRSIEGNYSIRLDHYEKNNLYWDNDWWNDVAMKSVISAVNMDFLPAGRHMYMSGTNYMYKNGGMSINNCAAISTEGILSERAVEMYTLLKNGCGVGYNLLWDGDVYVPTVQEFINDKNVDIETALRDTINAFTVPDTSLPIYTSLNRSSGKFINDVTVICNTYVGGESSRVRFLADLFNTIGAYIIRVGERRSAQIMLGSIHDEEFLNLKNYEVNPTRANIGFISNNSVLFEKTSDFEKIPDICDLIRTTSEPGFLNLKNIKKYGRMGDVMEDSASLCNPCGEIALDDGELCNLVSVMPSKSIQRLGEKKGWRAFHKALYYATIHASNASLLMTTLPRTNEVISRNRKIGISLSGLAYMFDNIPTSRFIKELRKGYDIVGDTNRLLAEQAGIPSAIKTTTIKPDGSLSLVCGVSAGIHFPMSKYAIRRVRCEKRSQHGKNLIASGLVDYETDVINDNLDVFSFPIKYEGLRTIHNVNLHEQMALLAMMQREWADNSVSMTVMFNEDEAEHLERVISLYMPIIKSASFMPLENDTIYPQMPIQALSKEEYYDMIDK